MVEVCANLSRCNSPNFICHFDTEEQSHSQTYQLTSERVPVVLTSSITDRHKRSLGKESCSADSGTASQSLTALEWNEPISPSITLFLLLSLYFSLSTFSSSFSILHSCSRFRFFLLWHILYFTFLFVFGYFTPLPVHLPIPISWAHLSLCLLVMLQPVRYCRLDLFRYCRLDSWQWDRHGVIYHWVLRSAVASNGVRTRRHESHRARIIAPWWYPWTTRWETMAKDEKMGSEM